MHFSLYYDFVGWLTNLLKMRQNWYTNLSWENIDLNVQLFFSLLFMTCNRVTIFFISSKAALSNPFATRHMWRMAVQMWRMASF